MNEFCITIEIRGKVVNYLPYKWNDRMIQKLNVSIFRWKLFYWACLIINDFCIAIETKGKSVQLITLYIIYLVNPRYKFEVSICKAKLKIAHLHRDRNYKAIVWKFKLSLYEMCVIRRYKKMWVSIYFCCGSVNYQANENEIILVQR